MARFRSTSILMIYLFFFYFVFIPMNFLTDIKAYIFTIPTILTKFDNLIFRNSYLPFFNVSLPKLLFLRIDINLTILPIVFLSKKVINNKQDFIFWCFLSSFLRINHFKILTFFTTIIEFIVFVNCKTFSYFLDGYSFHKCLMIWKAK